MLDYVFFFQAEDGIRDRTVTGVQTCALPISADAFPGEVVLDPFVGTGTTCAVAKSMRRRCVGIDINPAYVSMAQARVDHAPAVAPALLVGRAKYPGKDEL